MGSERPREIDLSDIERVPYHLREDAPPVAVCDRCGRKSWSVDAIGRRDGMKQPDGTPCEGTFESRVIPVGSERPPNDSHIIDESALLRAQYTAREKHCPERDRELVRAYVREADLDHRRAGEEERHG